MHELPAQGSGCAPAAPGAPTGERLAPVRRGALFLAAAGIVLAVGLVYGQVRTHEFLCWDDPQYIVANPMVMRGLTWEGVRYAFSAVVVSNWHPLTILSHMLDCQWFGLDAGKHLAVNAGLHALNSLLLFVLLRRLTGVFWPCLFVAAVFAVHPLNVETVAWAAQRKSLLSAAFFLLSLWCYAGARQTGRRGQAAAAFGLFALSLLCKPVVVMLPVVLLLLDFWPLRRAESARERGGTAGLLAAKLPFFALALAVGIVTIVVQHAGGAMRLGARFTLGQQLANVVCSYAWYLGKLFWPSRLGALYPFSGALPPGRVVACLALLLVLSAAAWWARRRFGYLTVGWLWYLVLLLPTIGLIQVGEQARADRYAYLPMIGVWLAVTWSVCEWSQAWSRRSRLPLAVLGAGIVVALAVCCHTQVGYWRDGLTLFKHTLAVCGPSPRIHNNLGFMLLTADRPEDAARQFETAVQLDPGYAEAYSNLGNSLSAMGRAGDAVIQYRAALRLDPTRPQFHANLGSALVRAGQVDEGLEHLQTAARSIALTPFFCAELARAFRVKGDIPAAIASYRQALAQDPDFVEARYELACLLLLHGGAAAGWAEVDQATAVFPRREEGFLTLADWFCRERLYVLGAACLRRLLATEPDAAGGLGALAWLLATCPDPALRDGTEAVRMAERANRIEGGRSPVTLDMLGAAYAEAGRFEEAIAAVQHAISLFREAGAVPAAQRAGDRLACYRAGKPWRQE